MNSKQSVLLVIVLAAALGLLLTPLSASASSSVARAAERELAKKPAEKKGNNIPRYKNGRGTVAPYSTTRRGTGLPWTGTFASVVMQKAGYKKHLRGGRTLPVVGGRAIGYVGAFANKARAAGQLRKSAQPGYLALFGNDFIAVVVQVAAKKEVTIIGGNIRDRVSKETVHPGEITSYIAPW